jgi:hypothetical protein
MGIQDCDTGRVVYDRPESVAQGTSSLTLRMSGNRTCSQMMVCVEVPRQARVRLPRRHFCDSCHKRVRERLPHCTTSPSNGAIAITMIRQVLSTKHPQSAHRITARGIVRSWRWSAAERVRLVQSGRDAQGAADTIASSTSQPWSKRETRYHCDKRTNFRISQLPRAAVLAKRSWLGRSRLGWRQHEVAAGAAMCRLQACSCVRAAERTPPTIVITRVSTTPAITEFPGMYAPGTETSAWG